VRYPDFNRYVREAYGLEPMAKAGSAANTSFACEIGLMEVQYNGKKTSPKSYIPLRVNAGNRFETTMPVKVGTKFKMEVKNTTECYIYVFGKETDGSSYTLFPYPNAKDPSTTKYSPFCGITGYRLFPKDKSMMPDSIGTKDMMVVVVSKQPLDWYKLNQTISQQPQTDYAVRVNNALRTQSTSNIRYESTSTGTIKFQGAAGNNQVATCVVEISKQ
jgi:hypothetical protein